MKKYIYIFSITALLAVSLVIGCKKQIELDTIIDNSTGNSSKAMASQLVQLYQSMPTYDFGKISLINEDILKFESMEHFEQVYETLYQQYRDWNDLFMATYDKLDDDEFDKIVESLNFDDEKPLRMFELKYKNTNNTLREMRAIEEEEWLEKGAEGPPPSVVSNEKIICRVEQTLFSKFYEVCIGDTICQLRPDGISILIPISALQYINKIRYASISELSAMVSILGISVEESQHSGGCYKASHKISRTFVWPVNKNYKFDWEYHFRRTWLGVKTTVTMKNYKYNTSNKKWEKNRRATCALGSETQTYLEINANDCRKGVLEFKPRNTPNNAYSRTKTRSISYPQTCSSIIRNDPAASAVLTRLYGNNYTFNAETGNLK